MQTNLSGAARAQLLDGLEPGEQLIWASKPDVDAMLRGQHFFGRASAGPSVLMRLLTGLVIVAALLALSIYVLALFAEVPALAGLLEGRDPTIVGVQVAALCMLALGMLRSGTKNDDFETWATALVYAITDRRVLVLDGADIAHDYTAADLSRPKLVPRRRSPGFSDILWGDMIEIGRNDQRLSPRDREERRRGFKALADGEAVLKLLQEWRQAQLTGSRQETADFFDAHTGGAAAEKPPPRRIVNSTQGFMLKLPVAWSYRVYYRKLAFGKWGIEREPHWTSPEQNPKWNAIRAENEIGTYLELQVQKTKPINTLDAMVNSSAAKLLGLSDVSDQQPDFEVNGLRGFYLTRPRQGRGSTSNSGDFVDTSLWQTRQYVLHDGTRQYYIEAAWPDDAPAERQICEAIVSTLRR